ncbi:MAG: hypothetical protein ACK40I_02450 [Tabrizicola sp.]
MRRRAFLAGIAAGVALGAPASAEDVTASIVRQLRRLGFRSIVQERTLLGRIRIVASRRDGVREIIVNPKTGEILRDLWTPKDKSKGSITIIDDRDDGGSGGRGGRGDDDDDHDDDDHDDDDDDEDDDDDDD